MTAMYEKTLKEMSQSVKGSGFIHEKHHELCNSELTGAAETYLSMAKPYLCTENATIALNYAAFLSMIPALRSYKQYRVFLWFMRSENAQETA